MIGKLVVSLAFAILVGMLVPVASADMIVTPNNNGTLIVPDGALITAMFFTPPGTTLTGFYTIDFQFRDGYGRTWGDYNDGDFGNITFTTPVSNLSIDWQTEDDFFVYTTDASGAVSLFDSCPTGGCFRSSGVASLGGSEITSLSWGAVPSIGGISSMTYSVDTVATPEPRSLLMLGSGLLAFVGLFRRKFSVCH